MLANDVLGPEPVLDGPQQFVLGRYWELREQTHHECGIGVETEDPIVAYHLRAMDRVYFEVRAEAAQRARDRSATRH